MAKATVFEDSKVANPIAWQAFKRYMAGKQFGKQETIQSWWDFLGGWKACSARVVTLI